MGVVVAVDAGTTGARALAVDELGRPVAWEYREFPQHFPRPGWVEHDPVEIWEAVEGTLAALRGRVGAVVAIGITNQRETTVVWDRRSGRPLAPAIVWQDRRTAGRCEELRDAGALPLVRRATGLVLDPYFSGTKLEWLLGPGGVEPGPDLAFGTVDAWLIWNLTAGAVHATDPSNASRTMLYDITSLRWSTELCALLGVPMACLPEVRPSDGGFGTVASGPFAGVPIGGVAGDQQAALYGQACTTPGMTKCTYGTGSFVLMHVGAACPPPVDGLLTSVGWQLTDGDLSYVLEGAVFVAGAAVQWLRDGLGLIGAAADIGPLAETVPDSGGVVLVPAFTGLGSPWWDPHARGTVLGLTRGSGRAQFARAVVESMAYQTRDVVDAMARAAGRPVRALRADGGASVMDLLLQLVANQLGVPVERPTVLESTAMGAAYLAGRAAGLWAATDGLWALDRSFTPGADRAATDAAYAEWQRAVERARGWASP